MATILAPNRQYDGVSAGVQFTRGVGVCTDPRLIAWFEGKGYTVQDDPEPPAQPAEPEPVPVKKKARKGER